MGSPLLKLVAPVPKIVGHQNAVFVGPHPDDIEVGAGGTALVLAKTGARLTYVVCTDGGCGSADPGADIETLAALRKTEAGKAAECLGVASVRFLDYPDGGRYDVWELALKLAALFAEIRPDIVFAPDPGLPSEIHPDHLKCGEAVRTAVFLSSFPLLMRRNGIPFDAAKAAPPGKTLAYYYTHRPNRYVGMTGREHLRKLEAVFVHESQFPAGGNEARMIRSYLDLRARRFGVRILRSHAEGFFVLSPVQQHAFPEVNNY
jgi:LmbE family N-acetylglucosaminyl deacetylase